MEGQTLDVKERAWHATTANDRSVGVEMCNIGALGDAPDPRPPLLLLVLTRITFAASTLDALMCSLIDPNSSNLFVALS